MNAPLAPALGNALEVRAALEVLAGSAKGRFGFVHSPCGTGLCHASQYADEERNCTVSGSVGSGRSTGSFRADDCRHGRADGFAENWNRYLPEASVILEVHAKQAGYISGFRGIDMGNVVVDLGGGRRVENDVIDPSVGIDHVLPLGTAVGAVM